MSMVCQTSVNSIRLTRLAQQNACLIVATVMGKEAAKLSGSPGSIEDMVSPNSADWMLSGAAEGQQAPWRCRGSKDRVVDTAIVL